MRSWRRTEHFLAGLLLAAFAFPAQPAGPARANELTFAAPRPGSDTRATAEARYPGGATDGLKNIPV